MLARLLTLAAAGVAAIALGGCNSAPIANDNSAQTAYGKSVDVDVLSNAHDPDGDQIHLVRVGKPMNGTAVMKNERTITYTPNAGFSGQDQVEFAIADKDKDHTRKAELFVNVAPEEKP